MSFVVERMVGGLELPIITCLDLLWNLGHVAQGLKYPGLFDLPSVIWNDRDQKFQMIYRASAENITGYAESKDGIHWTKPPISPDGKNNLITHRGANRKTFYEASFMIDPTVPWGHPEKYKAAFNPGNTKCAIAHSADGVNWKSYNDGEPVTGRAADTFNQILWDSIGKRYMLLTRTDLGADGGLQESRATRVMVHEKGNDLAAYPEAWKTLVNVNVDHPENQKSPGWRPGENHYPFDAGGAASRH